MSWQSYVDDHLLCELAEGHRLSAAAIIGQDGCVWAQSATFPELKLNEIKNIVGGFVENSPLPTNGLFLAGVKYMVVQGEEGAVIRGKKGQGGVTIKKTNIALLFGIYDDSVTPGECNVVVERLGDYLIDQGF